MTAGSRDAYDEVAPGGAPGGEAPGGEALGGVPGGDAPPTVVERVRLRAAALGRGLNARLVRDRLPASVAALLGVLAAAPTVFWPTYVVSPDPALSGSDGEPVFRQSFWSWDRIGQGTDDGGVGFDVSNTPSLLFLVAALVAGLAGVLVHLFRRGPDGRVLGAAAFASAGAVVVGAVVERYGRPRSGFFGADDNRLVVETQFAGWSELAAALLLVVAVGLVALPSLVRLARSAHAWSREVVRRRDAAVVAEAADRAGAAAAADGDADRRSRPRVGIATIRDVDPKDRSTWRAPRTGGAGVGFSDDVAAGSDPERFRPPT